MSSELLQSTPVPLSTPAGEPAVEVKKVVSTPSSSSSDLHTGTLQAIKSLIYYEDVTQSSVVFACGTLFYVITHVFDYSVISLFSYMLLTLIAISVGAALAAKAFVFAGYEVHPYVTKLQTLPSSENIIDEAAFLARARDLIAFVNKAHTLWNTVLTVGDIKLTAKVVLALYVVARLFQVITVMTLAFLVFVVAMTAPAIYHQNQAVIDAAVADFLLQAKTKFNELLEQAKASVGPAKEKALVALSELKAKVLAALSELVAKLPPAVGDKLKPYLPSPAAAVSAPAEEKPKTE